MALTRIVIWPGLAGSMWGQCNRPRRFEVYLAKNTSREFKLDDSPGPQSFILPMTETSFLRLRILDAYPGSRHNVTPVSEVELWGMKAD